MGLIVLVVAVLVAASWYVSQLGTRVSEGSFLVVEVGGTYVDSPGGGLLDRILGPRVRPMAGIISVLFQAERDPALAGVVIRLGALDVGWAKAQEIRDSIARVRAAGKRTVVHIELERFGANREYYVASAADAVYLAPGTRNPFLGLASEQLFLGGFFEKLGIDLEYERIGKYKSAAEVYAERSMSDANREMSEAILDDVAARFVGDVAEARGVSPERVHEIIDAAPTTPAQLLELGLVDGVAYYDEALRQEGDPETVELASYPGDVPHDPVGTLGLIYGTGPVVVGRSGPGDGRVLASEDLVEAFEEAVADEEVAAIVFRIDSPGGSALASDLVWRAVRLAREAGKPVVASMSDVAASGGYYVAAGADRIVALPGTLTGSIGVFVIRPVLEGLLDKLEIGHAGFTRGAHADLLLGTRPLSPGTRARLREDVESVYRLFVGRVSEGRAMDPASVDAVGQGRVFTGAQAHEAGLVDVLGGLRDAVREAKILAGMDPDADVVLQVYPQPKPLFQQLQDLMTGSLSAHARSLVDAHLPRTARTAVDLLGALPSGVPVLVPPLLPEVR